MYPELAPLAADAEAVLEVRDLHGTQVDGVSFVLRKGEILGIGGLAGQGQRDLFMTLFGARKASGGEILIDGKARRIRKPSDAIKLGLGKLDGLPVVIAVQDFDFMGGSLGMAAGEAVIKGLQTAAEKATPFIMFAASGGARMQEGILALMQLPRTTVAVEMLREAKQPYLVVLTNPTTGGVTASYAMLGDVQIAEPGALIGFAGPRVIEQTIREKLPEGFQRAEYLAEHGMVDMVVHRHKLRATLSDLCRVLTKSPAAPQVAAGQLQLPVPARA
jgi:acetyl-CoA carboxylase carboxyl transferase subunit beta